MNKTIIINGRIVLPEGVLADGCVEFADGKITAVKEGPYNGQATRYDYQCAGQLCFAGLYRHPYPRSPAVTILWTVRSKRTWGLRRCMPGTGRRALLPTTLTSTNEELLNTFATYKEAKAQNRSGAAFLGLHLEGPYFSYNQRGAQDPKYLRNPRPEEYETILAASDDIVRWSVAPELDGALEFGRRLAERGILPSIGHTDAIYEQVEEAYRHAGYTHVTHLYSCMSTITRRNAYRYAGALEAAYMMDDMTVEIIADGVHLPASLLKYVCKFKGPDKIALVTDSMRGGRMPEGETILGSLKDGQRVIIEDGVAKLPDRSAFAGSVATADRLVRTIVSLAGVQLADAVKMMTLTPARIMKVDDCKGSLAVGKDADIVIFDEEINVKTTIIGGKCLTIH